MEGQNRLLAAIAGLLAVSVLITGGLAIFLTMTVVVGEVESAGVVVDASPAAERIAYVSDREGDVAIWVMEPDGTGLERASGGEQFACFDPSWSPDGHRVAYWANEGELFANDGSRVGIWVADVDGEGHTQVGETVSDMFLVVPSWSWDGQMVAFAGPSEVEGNTTLNMVLANGGGSQRAVSLPWEIRRLEWSPTNSDILIITGDPQQGAAVRLWVADDEEVIEIFADASSADWSPGGDEIVVGHLGGQSVVILGQDWEQRVVAQLTEYPLEVRWSPDGSRVVVGTALARQRGFSTSLYVITLESGERATVIENEGWIVEPNWSPDGTRLLFTLGEYRRRPEADLPFANLFAYDVASGELERLTLEENFSGIGTWEH
jgi:Tol biopolymer transport system component